MKTYSLNRIYLKTGMVLAVTMLATAFTSCKKSNSTTPILAKNLNATNQSFNGTPGTTISNGLIAYWTFANTAYDLSGNGNNGTLNSVTTTSDRFGHTVGAYHFNGTSSYISVPDNAALRLSDTSFTVNAWVKLDAYNSSNGSIIMSKHIAGNNNGWSWSLTGSSASPAGELFFGPGGTSVNARGTTVVGLSGWHMVTGIYSYGNQQSLSFYVDGVFDNRTINIAQSNAAITALLYIGKDNPTGSYFLDGSLSDLRIYNRAITTTEINQLYNATTAPTAGLVAYWPLTNTPNDLSGNGNNGTLNSVTTTSDRFGNPIGAYHFNGTSSYISVPDNAALRLSDTSFTVNAWVKLDAYNSSNGSIIMSKHIAGNNNGWSWSLTGSSASPAGELFFGPGGTSVNARGTTVVGLSGWHMVTGIYSYGNQQSLSFYVDGVFDNRTINIAQSNAAITALLYIGKDNPTGSYFLDGSLSDLRIYNRAITTTEINQLYNALN